MSYPQLNKPSPELFYDLVNRTNGLKFKAGDLNLGAPAPGSHPEHSFVNTVITVTGTGTTTFQGPTPLHYRRLDLDLLFAAKNVNFEFAPESGQVNTLDVLAQLNARFLTQMDLSDIENNTWSVTPDAVTDILLVAKPTSLTYINQITLRGRARAHASAQFTADRDIVVYGSHRAPPLRFTITVPSDGAADGVVFELSETTETQGAPFQIPLGPQFYYGDVGKSSLWTRPAWLNWGLDLDQIGQDENYAAIVPVSAFPNGKFRFSLKTGTPAGTYEIVVPIWTLGLSPDRTHTLQLDYPQGATVKSESVSIEVIDYEAPTISLSIQPGEPEVGSTARVTGSVDYTLPYVPDDVESFIINVNDPEPRSSNFSVTSGLTARNNDPAVNRGFIYIDGLKMGMAGGRYDFAFDLEMNPSLMENDATSIVAQLNPEAGRNMVTGNLDYVLAGEAEELFSARHFLMRASGTREGEDTSGSNVVDPLVQITENDLTTFTASAPTGQGRGRLALFGAGRQQLDMELPSDYMFGLIHRDELERRRAYMPIAKLGYGDLGYCFVIPNQERNNYDPAGINLRVVLDPDMNGAWEAEIVYNPQGMWGRYLTEEHREQLSPFPASFDFDGELPPPVEMGGTTLSYNGKVIPQVRAYDVGLKLWRTDSRGTIWGGANVDQSYVWLHDSTWAWSGEFYGSELIDGKQEIEHNGATVGVEYTNDGERFKLYHLGLADSTTVLVFDSDRDNRYPVKFKAVSFTHPFVIRDESDSQVSFSVTEVGQEVEVPSGTRVNLVVEGLSVEDLFEVVMDIQLPYPDPNDNNQRSSVGVSFENMQFVGGESMDMYPSSRLFHPLGAHQWDIPVREAGVPNEFMAASAGAPQHYSGIAIVDTALNAYLDMPLVSPWDRPQDQDTDAPDINFVTGWFDFDLAQVTSADNTPVPSALEFGYGNKINATGQGWQFEGWPRFAISLPTGVLIERTPPDQLQNGLKWIYVDRRAPTVVGHGAIDMVENTVVQMVYEPFNDSVMLYAFDAERVSASDDFYWARSIPLMGNEMPNDVVLTLLESYRPAVVLYHRSRHDGKFCYHDRTGGGLGTEYWWDLPAGVGEIRIHRVEKLNYSGSHAPIVCVASDGRMWVTEPNDFGNQQPVWDVLATTGVTGGNFRLADFVPLSFIFAGSGARLTSWINGRLDANVDGVGAVTYRPEDETYRSAIGPFSDGGQVFPEWQREEWPYRNYGFNFRDSNGAGLSGHFTGVYWKDGQRVLRFGGPTLWTPEAESGET